MSDSTNPLPSAAQLSAARAERWHQNATPLLTLESLRAWLNAAGLVLYTPRPAQIPSPAPSFVEAVLGAANSAPAPAETDAARQLLARLVAEGAAVPLNLLSATGGVGTDVPDFVVSAAVFSYIFTLRGNKAWKLPPATAGAVKVSPLALAAYQALAERGILSVYDLTTHLGKEVTEAAVLRALNELWTQLRVVPVPQPDGRAAEWELAQARFTKQIKSGANAGQPSALSALISLYLGQALMATEDEIATFLSPLAPRSRLREVMHTLLGARQLDTLAIEGKTLLHVAGDLPAFAAAEAKPAFAAPVAVEAAAEGEAPRISKFVPRPGSKIGTGLRVRPAAGPRPSFGGKPAFGADRERRPFQRASADARPARPAFPKPGPKKPSFEKPSFEKPWDEERAARPTRPTGPAGGERPTPRTGDRPSYRDRPASPPKKWAGKPAFGRKDYGDNKPGFGAAGARPPRRESTPRPDGADSAPRKTFSKPGTFGRKREGFGGKRAFGDGDARPPRRDFAASGESDPRPARRPGSFTPRPSGGSRPAGTSRPSGGFAGRKPFTPRDGGDRPAYGGARSAPRTGGFERPGRPARGDRPERPTRPARPARGGAEQAGEAAPRKVYRKFDAPRASKSEAPRSGVRPPAKSAGKKPFAKAGGPFAKFADGAKPFRKPGPGKKSNGARKPKRGE